MLKSHKEVYYIPSVYEPGKTSFIDSTEMEMMLPVLLPIFGKSWHKNEETNMNKLKPYYLSFQEETYSDAESFLKNQEAREYRSS